MYVFVWCIMFCCRSLLLRAPQPPLVLGPRILSWLMQHFRDVDCSAAMTERVLQLACVQHFTQQQQQLSCLAPAAATGSRKVLAAAVKQLPHEQLVLCCKALLSHPAAKTAAGRLVEGSSLSQAADAADVLQLHTAAGAIKQLQAYVDKGSSSSSSYSADATDTAVRVLEDSVWGAMQAYGRWRLGVVLLDILARFTGGIIHMQQAVLDKILLENSAPQSLYCRPHMKACQLYLQCICGCRKPV